MKRLGPILMIAFGSVLTLGGLTSGDVRAGGESPPPCETVAPGKPAPALVVETTEAPCDDPCDTVPAPPEPGVQISIPCDDSNPCDTVPEVPTDVGADVSVPNPCEDFDPCDSVVTEAPSDAAVEISVPDPCDTVVGTSNDSGAGLPGAGSSSDFKLAIGACLVTLGAVLLLVRRRVRTTPLA